MKNFISLVSSFFKLLVFIYSNIEYIEHLFLFIFIDKTCFARPIFNLIIKKSFGFKEIFALPTKAHSHNCITLMTTKLVMKTYNHWYQFFNTSCSDDPKIYFSSVPVILDHKNWKFFEIINSRVQTSTYFQPHKIEHPNYFRILL